MDLSATITFCIVMVTLAALPSASVALVVTRSAVFGFRNGVAVAVGIVLADLLFVVVAVVGMTAFAQSAEGLFWIINYVAGGYIIYLGLSMMRSRGVPSGAGGGADSSTLMVSLLSGFLLTLGDVKAIFFYASLFPSLFDLRQFTRADVAMVMMITAFTVGGVKVVYAGLARSLAIRFTNERRLRYVRILAGGLLVGIGLFVIARAHSG